MRFNEVQFPRKFRPREDFSSNRSSELKNPNRAGEIYRAEIEFGKPKCNEVYVKSLLSEGEERSDESAASQSERSERSV